MTEINVGMVVRNMGQNAVVVATRKQDDMLLVKGLDGDGLMWVADPSKCVVVGVCESPYRMGEVNA